MEWLWTTALVPLVMCLFMPAVAGVLAFFGFRRAGDAGPGSGEPDERTGAAAVPAGGVGQ